MGKLKNQNIGKVIADINPGDGGYVAEFKYPYEIFEQLHPMASHLLEALGNRDGDLLVSDLKLLSKLKSKIYWLHCATLSGKGEKDPYFVKKYKEKEPDETWQEVSVYLECEYGHKFTKSWKDFVDDLFRRSKACDCSPIGFTVSRVQNIFDFVLFLVEVCDQNEKDSNEESEQ
ncbi:MAG: hypothetical protein VW714_08310 [Rhodospirillales bacterium]